MVYQFDDFGQLKKMTPEELAAEETADSYILVLDRGITEDGTPYWAYISVKPSRYEALVRVIRSGERKNLSDYGTIIKYGFDKEVPPVVKEEMLRDHHFDEGYMRRLEQEILAERKVFLEEKETRRIGDIVAMLKKKQ